MTAIPFREQFSGKGIGVAPSRPVDGYDLVTSTLPALARENSNTVVNHVFEQLGTAVAQLDASLRRTAADWDGDPYAIREAEIMERLLNDLRHEVEFHFDGYKVDQRR